MNKCDLEKSGEENNATFILYDYNHENSPICICT